MREQAAMKFGVNYTPSHGWFYMWLHPNWEEVRKDLDQIASLGVDHVRIFPLWPLLQPNRTLISKRALSDVRQMAALAGQAGLDCYVDVLQGHMSSFDFLPSWMLSWHKRQMFTDPEVVKAQQELVLAVYNELSDLECFAGLTLGNECNQFAGSAHPSPMRARSCDIQSWLKALLDPVQVKAEREGRLVAHCENDEVWYSDAHPFIPMQAANIGDVTTVHSWVFNGTAQQYGGLSQESVRHAEYLVQLAQAFAQDTRRQVWVQEIGAPVNVIAREQAPRFCQESIEHLVDCSQLYGITWWCSHNVSYELSDFPPLEHELGLFDCDGEITPVGSVFKEMVSQYSRTIQVSARELAIIIDTDSEGLPLLRSSLAPGGSVFQQWMNLSKDGQRPALITSNDMNNQSLLEARGIQQYLHVVPQPSDLYSTVSDPSAF